MDRLETVRQVVDNIVRQQPDLEESRCGFVHLYGVSATCVLLALGRGLDPQLAALAGMLHDLWTYQAGILDDHHLHGQHSAVLARRILGEVGGWTPAEIDAVAEAISRHSDKAAIDDDLSELLKDADVLQHYLYHPALEQPPGRVQRLARLARELGFPVPRPEGASGGQSPADGGM